MKGEHFFRVLLEQELLIQATLYVPISSFIIIRPKAIVRILCIDHLDVFCAIHPINLFHPKFTFITMLNSNLHFSMRNRERKCW